MTDQALHVITIATMSRILEGAVEREARESGFLVPDHTIVGPDGQPIGVAG